MVKALLVFALAVQVVTPVPKFDAGRAWEHLRQLVAIGPRPSGSPAIEQTRQYIKDQLSALGVATTEQTWEDQTPIDKVKMVNLVATIPGAHKDRIVFAGHYDTKLYREFRFVGASDGGSSAAFLLELARVLKNRHNPLTIELLFLDGEEARMPDWHGTDNTYGSRHYVDLAKRDGSLTSLKAMLLIDMIGDRDLDIRRDTNSTPWLTDTIWAAARHQNLDEYFIADSTRIEDDHLPFLAAGVPSVDIIDLDYEQWHTAKDTLDAVSARSLQVVGDVVLAALPQIEAHITKVTLTGRRVVRQAPYRTLKASYTPAAPARKIAAKKLQTKKAPRLPLFHRQSSPTVTEAH
ncbi:MAG TPA: M28 family peptidase [Vicinamibacterales bacterium]